MFRQKVGNACLPACLPGSHSSSGRPWGKSVPVAQAARGREKRFAHESGRPPASTFKGVNASPSKLAS